LRATPRAFFFDELMAAFGPHAFPRLRADPAGALDRIASALDRCHRLLVKPHWARIRVVMEADLAYRGALLVERGIAGVLPGLHEDVTWCGGEVLVRRGCTAEESGSDLLLSPSVFVWPRTLVDRASAVATIRYPARGAGRLWEAPTPIPGGTAAVLGRTKAA